MFISDLVIQLLHHSRAPKKKINYNFNFRWCVLFSHPADFTPVCTTELGRIAVHQPHFEKRNVKCLAHSVDSLKSHSDWVAVSIFSLILFKTKKFNNNFFLKDIKSYCLDIPGAFPYPIIADPTRDLAVKLGMIDDNQKDKPEIAETIRALFIISPDKRLRVAMYYPTSCGRNVDEILRCIDSLQLTDRLKVVATPANWTVSFYN